MADARKLLIVIADHPGYGAGALFAEAITRCSPCFHAVCVSRRRDPYGGAQGLVLGKDWSGASAALDAAEYALICDYQSLRTLGAYLVRRGQRGAAAWSPWQTGWKHLARWLAARAVAFFWTGSRFLIEHRMVVPAIARLGAVRFATTSLLHCDRGAHPLLQPAEIDPEPPDLIFTEPTACHSPGRKTANRRINGKGTRIIVRTFERLRKAVGLKSIVLSDCAHDEAVRIRGRCRFFVDKVGVRQVGGLGKSGLEAMLKGVPVVCDLNGDEPSAGPYAGNPALDCRTGGQLFDLGKRLVLDHAWHAERSAATLAWAQRLRYRPTVEYFESVTGWK